MDGRTRSRPEGRCSSHRSRRGHPDQGPCSGEMGSESADKERGGTPEDVDRIPNTDSDPRRTESDPSPVSTPWTSTRNRDRRTLPRGPGRRAE